MWIYSFPSFLSPLKEITQLDISIHQDLSKQTLNVESSPLIQSEPINQIFKPHNKFESFLQSILIEFAYLKMITDTIREKPHTKWLKPQVCKPQALP